MNREILFKAKRKNWKELPKEEWWVEGDLLHTRYGDAVLINNFEDQLFRCDGNMVCQFTGLHDNTKWGDLTEAEKESFLSDWNYREDRKNKIEDWSGRKIWENDIISISAYSYDEPEDDYFGVVTYCEKDACWSLNNNEKYGEIICECFGSYTTEIINHGNIFDNPELLEVE